MISHLFVALAKAKPSLAVDVRAVFIANEENSDIPGVGIDEMQKRGELDDLRRGPLIWGTCFEGLGSLRSLPMYNL